MLRVGGNNKIGVLLSQIEAEKSIKLFKVLFKYISPIFGPKIAIIIAIIVLMIFL